MDPKQTSHNLALAGLNLIYYNLSIKSDGTDILEKAHSLILDVLLNCEDVFFYRSKIAFLLIELISKKFHLPLIVSERLVSNSKTQEEVYYPILNNKLTDYLAISDVAIWLKKLEFDILNKALNDKRHIESTHRSEIVLNYNAKMQLVEIYDILDKKFFFKTYRLNTIVCFGKYNGLSILEIIEFDVKIILWYQKNLSHFILEWDVLLRKEILLKLGNRYLYFIRDAMIKNQFAWEHTLSTYIDYESQIEYSEQRDKWYKDFNNENLMTAYEFDWDNFWNTD